MRERERPALEKSDIVFSEPTGKLEDAKNNNITASVKVKGAACKRLSSESLSKLVLKKAMELIENANLPKELLDLRDDRPAPARNRKQTMPLGAAMYQSPASFSLVYRKTGEIIEIKSPFTIGAGTGVDYTVEDSSFMSREHAKLKIEGNALLLEDLGSLNGTFLNGEKINSFTVRINPGDTVKFADEEFIVQ